MNVSEQDKMLFRLWFLLLSKMAILGMALIAVGFETTFLWSPLVLKAGLWIFGPLAVAGAFLAVSLVLSRGRMTCPMCNRIGKLVTCGARQPGVKCPECGLVIAKDMLLSWQLITISDENHDDI